MVEYELSKPINGVTTINIDLSDLTMADYKAANAIKAMLKNANGNLTDSFVPRADPELRIALAWASAVKHNPVLAVNDILSMSVIDGLQISEAVLDSFRF